MLPPYNALLYSLALLETLHRLLNFRSNQLFSYCFLGPFYSATMSVSVTKWSVRLLSFFLLNVSVVS